MQKTLCFFITLTIITVSCKKEITEKQCENLSQAMSENNISLANDAITRMIDRLPSQAHTQENFEKLATGIGGNCGIKVNGKCFGCVFTLPTISEIYLTINFNGTTINRVIDISQFPSGKMKFVTMHD